MSRDTLRAGMYVRYCRNSTLPCGVLRGDVMVVLYVSSTQLWLTSREGWGLYEADTSMVEVVNELV